MLNEEENILLNMIFFTTLSFLFIFKNNNKIFQQKIIVSNDI